MSHIPNTNTVPASTGGCTSATATTAGSASDEVAPAGPTDPDIPRLTLTLTESMDVRDDDKDVCSPMHVDQYDYDGQQETEAAVHAVERKTGFEVLEYRRYPERAEDEEEEELCSELGNEQDDEDDHETDKAEEDDDEREGGGDDEEEDRASQFAVEIEASFISRTKPACSKTTLVSCLSARSVSPGPGPISPLLSEDDYMNAHGTSASASSSDFYTPPTSATPSLLSCNSASSSRRSSSGAHTPRVRFKRGCVITAVNLTWAAATYDRAPIDVAESLDIKRCQTIADCTEGDVIPAEAFEEPCGAPVLHFQECDDGLNEVDDYVPDADDVLATLEQMRQQQQLGRSLCGGDSSTDEDDERLYRTSRYETPPSDDEGENYDLHPCGGFKDEGLPRSSSFSTAYLSGSNEFDVTPLGSYSGRSSTFTAAPPSPPLQSSPCTAAHVHYAYASTFGAGSPSRAAAEGLESLTVPALSPDESSTGSGSESDDCGGVWRLPTNVGPASATRARQYIPSTASSLSSATADTSLGLAAAELCAQVREEERYPGRLRGRSPTPQSQTSSGESSRRVTPSHEVSPPPQEEQPVRKQPRRGLCGMGKWSRDDVFDSCDALGGF